VDHLQRLKAYSRHSACLAWCAIKATQERLGHSTSKMILEVFSHATAVMQEQAVTALDELYDRTKVDQPKINGQIGGQSENSKASEAN